MTQKIDIESIKIDPELRDLLCPLSEGEFKTLRGSLLADGCLQPLIIDEKTGVLIDGHNRFKICKEENIPFEVKTLIIGGRESIENWIIRNQVGRRNLTAERMEVYIARIYKHAKKPKGFQPGEQWEGNAGGKPVQGQNDLTQKTSNKAAKDVGEKVGKSEATVRRIEKKIDAIDKAGKLAEYEQGKLPKAEVKKIVEDSKPLRKQTKAEAKEEEDVLKENPHLRDPEKAAEVLKKTFGEEWFRKMIQAAGIVDSGKGKAPAAKRNKPAKQKTKEPIAKPKEKKDPAKASPKVVLNEYLSLLTLTGQQPWIMEDLKKDIQKNGVKEPLIVQQGTNILVDGYKRHKICQELKIPFHVQYDYFESMTEIAKQIVIDEANALKKLKDENPPAPNEKDPYRFYVSTLWNYFRVLGLEERDSIDISQEASRILGYEE